MQVSRSSITYASFLIIYTLIDDSVLFVFNRHVCSLEKFCLFTLVSFDRKLPCGPMNTGTLVQKNLTSL